MLGSVAFAEVVIASHRWAAAERNIDKQRGCIFLTFNYQNTVIWRAPEHVVCCIDPFWCAKNIYTRVDVTQYYLVGSYSLD